MSKQQQVKRYPNPNSTGKKHRPIIQPSFDLWISKGQPQVLLRALHNPRSLNSAKAAYMQRTVGNNRLGQIARKWEFHKFSQESQVQLQPIDFSPLGVIQLSPLSSRLRQIWTTQGKGSFFNQLRKLTTPVDADTHEFVRQNLVGDDQWLAQNLLTYGSEARWPIHLQIKRSAKHWKNSGGKSAVFNILRAANGAQSSNVDLSHVLSQVFPKNTEDLWLAKNLQYYGTEQHWPIHLRVKREMIGWADSGGKGAVFNVLRTANGLESSNTKLTAILNQVFQEGSQDLWLALRLQSYGTEGKFPPKQVNNATGRAVDQYLNSSKLLHDYVKEKFENGFRARGHIHIYPPSQFIGICVSYLMRHKNESTGKLYTRAEAVARVPNINAFQEGSEIHVRLDRGEVATTIHESVHLFSHRAYISRVGFHANEGTTEYFTRIICREQKIKRGNYYPNQYQSVSKLVKVVGKGIVAEAYFEGDVSDLQDEIDDTKGEGKFLKWVSFMRQGKFADADSLLK